MGEMLLYLFYASYFPYDRSNGTQTCKCNGKDQEFDYNSLIIGKYNQTCIYIKGTDGNMKMCTLWAVAIYTQLQIICIFH